MSSRRLSPARISLVLTFVFLSAIWVSDAKTYILGVMLPYTGTWPIGRSAAGAMDVALDKINSDETLTAVRAGNHNFTAVWRNSQCLDNVGLPLVVDLWAKEQVDGFIGECQKIYSFKNKP